MLLFDGKVLVQGGHQLLTLPSKSFFAFSPVRIRSAASTSGLLAGVTKMSRPLGRITRHISLAARRISRMNSRLLSATRQSNV